MRRASPRKKSNEPFPVASLISDYLTTSGQDETNTLHPYYSLIPDCDWRLLAALARKRENEAQREAIAKHLQKLWDKEKELRESISNIIVKAVEDRARASLAANRRYLRDNADQIRARSHYVNTKIKTDLATKRRTTMLRDASRRIAITSALNEWDTTLARHDMTAMEVHRRTLQEAHIKAMDARSYWIARNKAERQEKARIIAEITAELRTVIKQGRRISV